MSSSDSSSASSIPRASNILRIPKSSTTSSSSISHSSSATKSLAPSPSSGSSSTSLPPPGPTSRKRRRVLPPPPSLPPTAPPDELPSIPYDANILHMFKSPAWISKMNSFTGARYRPAKLILSGEQYQKYPPTIPAYPHLRSSPSQYPRKKYCDISHYPAQYTEPTTRLHYCDSVRYAIVKSLSREQINARLALRKAQLSEIK